MKKFDFRLESVLKVRALRKKMAEREVAQTQASLNKADRELENVRQAYAGSFGLNLFETPNPAFAAEVLQRYREDLKKRETRLDVQRQKINEKLTDEKKILTYRLKDEMVMDKLKDYQKQEYMREVDGIEQKEIEEIDLLKRGLKS